MEGGARRFYAVRQGRMPGIYTSWPPANRQVKGFSNCQHRSFATLEEAVAYMDRGDDIDDGALVEQPIMVPPIAEVGPGGGARIQGGRGRGTHAANTSSASSFCSWQNR
ncbi:hypothetical protein PIB30_029486 [Stylosanthes scabra]|uniref:Ribonuclease H1 N-terminal domain-containing protein n=1 Tax=Stylosanthes scabra TaxID=79078 RepID=A0ABU6RBZ3_9FABA|nr:hypothetical protein [Stylosanthes scabra]